MSWIWGAATNPQYEELVEKACSPLNLPYPQSEDIATNLEITDLIRSKAVQPKLAMQSLKRRVASKNGRVQMYALGLIDTCIKNGGDHFLAEIASKEFVDEMSALLKSPVTNAEVKQMALRHFQSWAIAFKSKSELSFFVDVYNELKSSGIQFPPPPSETSSHLLTTTTAPAWVDSDVCMRCRTAFTFTNRKHHCRNCGLVFDQACSSHTMPLPRFGIAEEVRVCEGCWTKSGKGKVPTGPPPIIPGRTPRSREDLDADLQRAIELSLAESQPGGRNFVGSEPPLARTAATVEDDDEELRMAIEASLRDQERIRPSAPIGTEEPEYKPLPTFDLSARETETILTFSNTLDQMAAYGERDLRRFPHAHILAEQAYALGGKLQRNAEEKTTKQQMLAEMQSKLSQAVSMYGQILDGQQAYSARRLQEQQQRQYQQQQQQQQYGYAPTQHYSPYGQMNGHASPYPSYAPPQHSAYHAATAPVPEQAKAGPSIYPSMPSFNPSEQYAPPIQSQVYPAYQQHQPYEYGQNSQQQPLYAAAPPVQQWQPQPQPQDVQIQRQSSLRVQAPTPPMASHPPPQRQASNSYAASPPQEGYNVPSAPLAISTEASAPPPIDLASHPASSPTNSISNLPPPARSANYTSPSPLNVPLPTSPQPTATQPVNSWQQQQYSQQQISPQQQQQQYNQQPQQPQQYNQQLPQQQYPPQHPNLYNETSFPAAPAAVFPDAPSVEPKGLEKQEREEALLIEL